ncbi:hypothetical protein ACD661_11390 [Legionella lytica]|uniref:Transmembrane protein n=1 Tax=Legionella lytica TaxID=96232 RepID=A0ABW8DAZ9_9GAMM
MGKLINFFKDKNGRIVILQIPNGPLIAWFIFTILNLLLAGWHSQITYIFHMLSFGFIFTWAWLELTSGVNYFRRTLGLIVLIINVALNAV